jgi:carboxypeptidase family protein/TonB-dependent receptor-like protein
MPRAQLSLRSVFLGGLMLLLVVGCVQAQIDRATLAGTVTDPTGAVIRDAKIHAKDQATGLESEAESNSQGAYRVPGLAVGTYTVTVSHTGFATAEFQDVLLLVGQTRTLDARLKVGAVMQKIVVEVAPTALEQTSPELSGVINKQEIQALPVNGRNWASLLLLAPGAIDDGGGDQRTIRFAGRGRDDNNYTMDGVDATGIQEQAQKSTTRLQISEEAVAEYRVSSMLYTAEHGAGAGGQVDLVSKTGTNDFHGSIFEFLRNSMFDARQFTDFDNVTGRPILPPFHLNQYGLSFGGPIKKDKTFFFLTYEGLRQAQTRSLVASLPSDNLLTTIVNTSPPMGPIVAAWRLAVKPGDGNSDCANPTGDPTIDPQAQCIFSYIHPGSVILNEDSWTARLDHKFNDQNSVYLRATRDVSFTAAPLGNYLDTQQIITHPANYIAAWQHSFSRNVFNEAKFGINRAPYRNPQASVLPVDVSTASYEEFNNPNTDLEIGTTFGYIDNLAVSRGHHTFKTGIEVRRVRLNQGITEDDRIDFPDNASLINDSLDTAEIRHPWYPHGLRHTFVLPYFQDEWKVRPNLTLNLGMRWEYYSVITEAHGHMTIFDVTCNGGFLPGTTIPERGLCPKGSPAYFPNYRNWDPRVGIAWAPSALHDKTVIRTGFGIYHGAGQNDDLNASLESDTYRAAFTSTNCPGGLSYPINTSSCLGFVPHSPRALQRHRRDLYVEQWGLSVQQALPGDFIFQSSYMGTHGVRLFYRNYINLCGPDFQSTGICAPQFPAFGQIDIKRDIGTSTFNAGQFSLERQMKHGWMWEVQYMLSHSINEGGVGGGEANAPENANCIRCDLGPSVFDTRHNLTATGIYDLPFGPGQHFLSGGGFLGKIFGGWSLSGIGLFHTGHPLTPLMSLDGSQIPDGNAHADERPDLVPGVSVIPPHQNRNNWININAFAIPAMNSLGIITHFGDSPRGIIRAPKVWQADMALTKRTKITEKVGLEFRAEAFNIFNRTQLGDVGDLDIRSGPPVPPSGPGLFSGFGAITTTVNFNNNNDSFSSANTGTGLPRQLEFMLRLTF